VPVVLSVEPEDPVPATVVTAVERLNSVPWMDPPICDVVLTVVSVVSEEDELLFLAQEMIVRLKRNREKRMSICLTWFPFGGLGGPNIYHDSGVFYKNVGILLGGCLNFARKISFFGEGLFFSIYKFKRILSKERD